MSLGQSHGWIVLARCVVQISRWMLKPRRRLACLELGVLQTGPHTTELLSYNHLDYIKTFIIHLALQCFFLFILFFKFHYHLDDSVASICTELLVRTYCQNQGIFMQAINVAPY